MSNTLKLGNGKWATGKDTLLAYNDENNNFKPLPFSFSRASNATVVNEQGLIELVGSDEPRIDFKDDAKGALLLEPNRSNLFTYSEAINQGSWSKSNASILENTAISPNGTLNAETFSITSNFGFFYKAPSLALGTTVTQSIFVKNIDADRINLQVRTSSTAGLATFFFDNSEITNVTLTNGISAEFDYYGNGWYRVYLTCTTTEANQLFRFQLNESEMSCYVWGAQVEQGSYATSYIPTNVSAATRVADVCNNGANEQVINSTEGVLYVEMSAIADDLTNRRITISDNSTNNRVVLGFSDASNSILALVGSSGTQFIATIAISDIKLNNKFALKYKENDFALWVNGIEIATDTSGNTPVGLSTLKIQGSTGFSNFYGNVKQIQYFNTALTDQELQALTT